jgi:hypothetical protein
MLVTFQNIYNLASDKDAFARAKKHAHTRKWKNLQSNGKLTWGESKSSGASFYKTIFDNTHPEKAIFHCTCPSRKRPCKHSIALALLLLEQSGAFHIIEGTSDWAKDLIAKKSAPPPTLEEAEEIERKRAEHRLKTREKRLQQMATGLQELDLWLADILQQGLARAEEQGDDFWENLSARMVDAKLGGIGKRVLNLQNLRGTTNWHEKMLAELGEIHLLSKGFQNLEKLPPHLQEELLNVTGINYKREDLIDHETVEDTWLIIGQTEHTADDKLYERRTYLYGENIDRIGLLLDFAFQTEPYKEQWQVGQIFKAGMIFYPSSYPMRMFAKVAHRIDEPVNWQGYYDLSAFADAYAMAIGDNPWLARFPAFLMQVTPVSEEGKLLLTDTNQQTIPARLQEDFDWKLLAISGGHPISVFGEWDGERLSIMSAMVEDRFVHFTLPPLKRKDPVWRRF